MPLVRPLRRGRGSLLLAALLSVLPILSAQSAPTRTSRSSRKARPAEPAPAPAEEAAPKAEVTPASARTVLELPPPPAPTPAPKEQRSLRPERVERESQRGGPGFDRIGVGVDYFGEGSRMEGSQAIQGIAQDESFDYGAGGLSATVWLMTQPLERVRVGPGVRIFGGYGGQSGREYRFGLLNELFLMGEYAHPAFERFELVLGGRAGVALLFPGDDFAGEIERLQASGADVWSVPRVGWLVGASVGVRRHMVGNLSLRLDALGQLERVYLFATDSRVSVGDAGELRFQKFWSTGVRRLGLTLGVELGF
ncbi:MAG: hypothetical protein L0Y64_21465 [Myxococcaceae bacterium]|nr:hypothetical protein [Myxococcaceae bacterium]